VSHKFIAEIYNHRKSVFANYSCFFFNTCFYTVLFFLICWKNTTNFVSIVTKFNFVSEITHSIDAQILITQIINNAHHHKKNNKFIAPINIE